MILYNVFLVVCLLRWNIDWILYKIGNYHIYTELQQINETTYE